MSRARRSSLLTLLVAGSLAAGALLAGPASADTVTAAPTGRLDVGAGVERFVVDAAGATYAVIANDDTVKVFAPGASGDAVPIRTLAGDKTGLHAPAGLAVDRFGYLYVVNNDADTVTIYAPSANGNAAPVQTITATGMRHPIDIDLGPTGDMYVVAFDDANHGSVLVLPSSAAGATTPLRVISGAHTRLDDPIGIALDGDTLYVSNYTTHTVCAFPATGNGDIAPTRAIGGVGTGLSGPFAIDTDDAHNLYVGNIGSGTVEVFAPTANGNVAPIRTLSGAATTLRQPAGVRVGADRSVRVADFATGTINTYRPLVPKPVVKRAPSAVRALTVTGAKKAKKRLVTWSVPASPGTSPITGYQVVVKKKRSVLLTKSVTKLKVKLKAKKLAYGKLKVTVTPRNAVGYGPATTVKFKVKPA